MEIKTDRLVLRHLRDDDGAWIAREISNPKVHQWLTSPPSPYTEDDATSFIARNKSNELYRVIEQGFVPCGVVSLTKQDNEPADLGYWLTESAWGQGLMTEAASALLAWNFQADQADVLSGWIQGNQASRNVLEKLGFEPFGRKRARSEFHQCDVTVDKVTLSHSKWQTLRAET